MLDGWIEAQIFPPFYISLDKFQHGQLASLGFGSFRKLSTALFSSPMARFFHAFRFDNNRDPHSQVFLISFQQAGFGSTFFACHSHII